MSVNGPLPPAASAALDTEELCLCKNASGSITGAHARLLHDRIRELIDERDIHAKWADEVCTALGYETGDLPSAEEVTTRILARILASETAMAHLAVAADNLENVESDLLSFGSQRQVQGFRGLRAVLMRLKEMVRDSVEAK